MRHVLKDVKLDRQHNTWSALCTCGKWAVVMCKTAQRVRQQHKEHKRFAKEHGY